MLMLISALDDILCALFQFAWKCELETLLKMGKNGDNELLLLMR